MNQTTNYKLSQWEATDRIQMEDFNSDNAKLDTALAAETAARIAADSTEKSERESAIASEANSRMVADTAEINARKAADNELNSAITAEIALRSAGDLVVQLLDTFNATPATQYNVSLSGIDTTSYSRFLLLIEAPSTAPDTNFMVRCNKATSGYRAQNETGVADTNCLFTAVGSSTSILESPPGREYTYSSSYYHEETGGRKDTFSCYNEAISNLTTINILPNSSTSTTLPARTRIMLYGLKY